MRTREAAALAGLTPAQLRAMASVARRRHGVELQLPRSRWPDGRTPLYDERLLRHYLTSHRQVAVAAASTQVH